MNKARYSFFILYTVQVKKSISEQRALEREVRKAKRKVEGSLAPEDIKKAKAELREAQKNVREYIAKVNAEEGARVLARNPLQEKIYSGDIHIGSSAEPVHAPESLPANVSDGHSVEVDIPADKTVENAYTDVPVQKIVNNQYIDKYPNSDIIEAGDKKPEIPEEIINDVNMAVDKVAEDFPVIRERVEPIVFADTSPDLGENGLIPDKAINVIRLSDDYCSDYSKLCQKLAEDFESHFSYETDNVGSLACHELGHAIHKILAMKRAGVKYGEVLTPIKKKIFEQELQKIKVEVYLAAFSDETLEEIDGACVGELGTMTYRNPDELIAQSFGNYYYGKTKSRVGNAIVEYFKRGLV